jgi:CRISPR-associated exonuclease Cas4
MWMFISFLISLVIVTLLLRVVWQRQHKNRWLPPELKNAKPSFVEHELLASFEGEEIVGRLDRAYQLSDGRWSPMEFKTRNYYKVFETDIAELSLQAWMLREQGFKTSAHGYVVIQHNETRQRRAFSVDLWSNDRCEMQILRRRQLMIKATVPVKTKDRRCMSCGHQIICARTKEAI